MNRMDEIAITPMARQTSSLIPIAFSVVASLCTLAAIRWMKK
jgi:hypothetical protein